MCGRWIMPPANVCFRYWVFVYLREYFSSYKYRRYEYILKTILVNNDRNFARTGIRNYMYFPQTRYLSKSVQVESRCHENVIYHKFVEEIQAQVGLQTFSLSRVILVQSVNQLFFLELDLVVMVTRLLCNELCGTGSGVAPDASSLQIPVYLCMTWIYSSCNSSKRSNFVVEIHCSVTSWRKPKINKRERAHPHNSYSPHKWASVSFENRPVWTSCQVSQLFGRDFFDNFPGYLTWIVL